MKKAVVLSVLFLLSMNIVLATATVSNNVKYFTGLKTDKFDVIIKTNNGFEQKIVDEEGVEDLKEEREDLNSEIKELKDKIYDIKSAVSDAVQDLDKVDNM